MKAPVDDRRRSPESLDVTLRRIYDHLYANASIRTPAAIAAEVGKLLRVATFIETVEGASPAFDLDTSAHKALLRGEADEVATFSAHIRERFEVMSHRWGLYKGDPVVLADADIAWTCAQLQGVKLSTRGRDVFGDAVEVFRTSWAKQSSGQFFTDARVTGLAMALLRFDPLAGDDLIDICCGTGGFLLAGLDVIEAAVDRSSPGERRASRVRELALRTLRGQEVDPEIAEVARASLGARIGAVGASLVSRGDSLVAEAFGPGREGLLVEGTHRCAASNPPFGTKITVKSADVLGGYELARAASGRTTPRPPDILLLERNLRMLAPGVGRLAIVLPYQVLSGPQMRFVRAWLLRQAHLEAVIDLPPETFQPHTGTKTSLVVLRRRPEALREVATDEPGEVFMATPRWIGHDRRGHTVYRTAPDGGLSAEVLSDIEAVAEAFAAHCRGDDPSSVHGESARVELRRVTGDPDLRLNARYYREGMALEGLFARRAAVRARRLSEVTERIFFPPRFKRRYVAPGPDAVPFLGGAHISQLHHTSDKWLSADDERLVDLTVRAGWLLVTRSGTTGVISSVPRSWDGVAVSEHVIRIVPRPEVLHPAWIQAYLRSAIGQRALARGVFGSVIDEITTEFLGNVEIPLPSDDDQYERVVEAITTAESARDRAIGELNRAVGIVDDLFGATR